MNKEKFAERRSLFLHKAIAKKLRKNPELWDIPKQNLNRWKENMGDLPPALHEWEKIINTYSKNELFKIFESKDEKSARLRSSSPFTGILTQEERLKIFIKK